MVARLELWLTLCAVIGRLDRLMHLAGEDHAQVALFIFLQLT